MKKLLLPLIMLSLFTIKEVEGQIKTYEVDKTEFNSANKTIWRGTMLEAANRENTLFVSTVEYYLIDIDDYFYYIILMGSDNIGCVNSYSSATFTFMDYSTIRIVNTFEETVCWKGTTPPVFTISIEAPAMKKILKEGVKTIKLSYSKNSKTYTIKYPFIFRDMFFAYIDN